MRQGRKARRVSTDSMKLATLLATGACAACSGPQPLDEPVAALLAQAVEDGELDRSLTGVWTSGDGARFLIIHSGEIVTAQPVGANEREDMDFAEGILEGTRLSIVPYKQGASTETSWGGMDVLGVRTADVDRQEETITWDSGACWKRGAGAPGAGALTGVWMTSKGRVAIMHEGEFLTACSLAPTLRAEWTVGYARLGADGRVRMLRLREGRVRHRKVGWPGHQPGTIEWLGGSVWTLDSKLRGAPPAPPHPISPGPGVVMPNIVDGILTWGFDWSDVPGATEYRIEVSQADASRPFLIKDGIGESHYLHTKRAFSLSRLDEWTWRVAAKEGGVWTEWSMRTQFQVEEE